MIIGPTNAFSNAGCHGSGSERGAYQVFVASREQPNEAFIFGDIQDAMRVLGLSVISEIMAEA